MFRSAEHRRQNLRFIFQAGLCLLLVALCLYNPFFTIFGASQVSNVQHDADYRATVAGSELRRCIIEPAPELTPALEASLFVTVCAFEPRRSEGCSPAPSIGSVQQQSRESLWFRPPPAVQFAA
jgi:hypothetical protein